MRIIHKDGVSRARHFFKALFYKLLRFFIKRNSHEMPLVFFNPNGYLTELYLGIRDFQYSNVSLLLTLR